MAAKHLDLFDFLGDSKKKKSPNPPSIGRLHLTPRELYDGICFAIQDRSPGSTDLLRALSNAWHNRFSNSPSLEEVKEALRSGEWAPTLHELLDAGLTWEGLEFLPVGPPVALCAWPFDSSGNDGSQRGSSLSFPSTPLKTRRRYRELQRRLVVRFARQGQTVETGKITNCSGDLLQLRDKGHKRRKEHSAKGPIPSSRRCGDSTGLRH